MCTELAASLIGSLTQLATIPCRKDGANATKGHMKVLNHLKMLLKLHGGTGKKLQLNPPSCPSAAAGPGLLMVDFDQFEIPAWVSLPCGGGRVRDGNPPAPAHVIIFLNILKSPQSLQFMVFFYFFSHRELQCLTARAGTCYSIAWSHRLCSDGSSDPERLNYI